MSIKAILFDLDDTLLWDERSVKEAFQATCQEAAKHYDVPPEKLEAAVRQEARNLYEGYETFSFTKMIGINPFEALWAHFSEGENPNFKKLRELAPSYRAESWTRGLRALGIEDPDLGYRLGELFPKERRSRPLVYESTFRVLDRLKEKYRLLLLTNGAPDLQKEKIAGFPKLAPYFEHIVISGEFGEGKPAASIFRHAMRLLGIEPGEGIMIGDKLTTDILGSNGVGMKNIWINHHRISRTDEIVPAYEVHALEDILPIIEAQD
jgi:putative hydrolase of the HAD superfamily